MAGRRLLNASSRPPQPWGSRCLIRPAVAPRLRTTPVPPSPAIAAFPPPRQPAARGPHRRRPTAPGAGWLWKRLHGRQERLLVLQPSCLLDRNFKPDVFSHRAEICFCLSAKPIGNTASVAIRAGGVCAFFPLYIPPPHPLPIPAEEWEFVRVQVAFSREL